MAPTRSPSRDTRAEAAAVLRRLLAAIEAGEVEIEGREALGLLRRLEGALAAWEAARGARSKGGR